MGDAATLENIPGVMGPHGLVCGLAGSWDGGLWVVAVLGDVIFELGGLFSIGSVCSDGNE